MQSTRIILFLVFMASITNLLYAEEIKTKTELIENHQTHIIRNTNKKSFLDRLCENANICKRDTHDFSIALVVGVSEYKYLKELEYTKRDAKDISSFLLENAHFDEVILLENEQATRETINYFIEDYIPNKLNKKKFSRFLFYFSGHGERRPDTGRGYLRLAGDKPEEYSGSIGMDLIQTWARHNTKKATHSLYLIDSCLSGIAGESMGSTFRNFKNPEELLKNEASVLITAGDDNQITKASSEWGGSIFKRAILEGLARGEADTTEDGVITAQELFTYMDGVIPNETRQHQTPTFTKIRKLKDGDFFFISPKKSSSSKPLKDRESYQIAMSTGAGSPTTINIPLVPKRIFSEKDPKTRKLLGMLEKLEAEGRCLVRLFSPAKFKTKDVKIEISPAHYVSDIEPAFYEMKHERIIVKPSYIGYLNEGGIYTPVEFPARYKNIIKRVVLKESTLAPKLREAEYVTVRTWELVSNERFDIQEATCPKDPNREFLFALDENAKKDGYTHAEMVKVIKLDYAQVAKLIMDQQKKSTFADKAINYGGVKENTSSSISEITLESLEPVASRVIGNWIESMYYFQPLLKE